jgi:DNA-binding winged helix-turn-helix (wHTH) protein
MKLDSPRQVVRFQDFEVDLSTGELRKSGHKIRFSGQPMQILTILLERPGELVSRDELRKRLWPDTFVDVDHSLNAAVNRIREALGDSAERPRYIETLPRRGYRFISEIDESFHPRHVQRALDPASYRSNVQLHRLLIIASIAAAIAIVGWLINTAFRSKLVRRERTITRLTFGKGLQTGATWSPDGSFIAYSSAQEGKTDIWVQHTTGGEPLQITKGPGNNWQPDWSPDGKYIAYRSEDENGGIFVIPAFGSDTARRKISDFGVYPRWSPDGKQILFLSVGFAAVCGVFVKDVDGSSKPREVMREITRRAEAMSAVWHPDGKRITVWEWTLEPTALPNFWTGDSHGGSDSVQTQIPPDLASVAKNLAGENMGPWADADFRFAWGPGGNALYFERSFRGAKNIWRMTVDPGTLQATGLERVTTGSENESDFALSPEPTKIAFTSDTNKVQAWTFPFDAVRGRLIGPGEPVTSEGMEAWQGALSRTIRGSFSRRNAQASGSCGTNPLRVIRERHCLRMTSTFATNPNGHPMGNRWYM